MPDSPVTVAWTPTNWITILLMVAIGFAVLGFIARLWQQKQSQSS